MENRGIPKYWKIHENSIITENMFPISLKSFHLLLENTYGRYTSEGMMEHDTTCISRETCAYLPRPSISEVFQSRTLFLRPGMRFVLAVQAFSCWFMCFWMDKILAKNISNFQCTSDVIPCHSSIDAISHFQKL